MILSGKLFPAAFVEVMLLWGKVHFHAIKKQTCPSNCFSTILQFLCNKFNYICISTNYIKSYLPPRGVPWQLSCCFYTASKCCNPSCLPFYSHLSPCCNTCKKSSCALQIDGVPQNLLHLSVVHCFSNITLHLFRHLPLNLFSLTLT